MVRESAEGLPFVSVIIPVYNDPLGLDRCLQALTKQTCGVGRFEVLVVDNGSDPESRPPDEYPPLEYRLLDEPVPGSYMARNHGVRHARGQVLAFTDADCRPIETWIDAGTGCLTEEMIGAATGPVEIDFRNPRRPTAIELYESLHAFTQEENATKRGFGVTANLFVPAGLWKTVGEFDEALASGGDLEWGGRLTAKGFMVRYCSDARVFHPARESWSLYSRRIWRLLEGYDARRRRSGYGALHFVADLISVWFRVLRSPIIAWRNLRHVGGLSAMLKYVLASVATAVISTYARLAIRLGVTRGSRFERAR